MEMIIVLDRSSLLDWTFLVAGNDHIDRVEGARILVIIADRDVRALLLSDRWIATIRAAALNSTFCRS